MANAIRSLMAVLALMLATACSLDTMIENMTSEEDRAMTQSFIDHVRARDMAALGAMIDPDIWKESVAPLEEAATLYPEGGGETRIISYSMNSDGFGDGARTRKDFVLVTTDERLWTTTEIVTLQEGGDPMIIGWHVDNANEAPAELEIMENMGTVFLWAGIIGLVFLIGIVILVVWLVRRSRRKSANAGIS